MTWYKEKIIEEYNLFYLINEKENNMYRKLSVKHKIYNDDNNAIAYIYDELKNISKNAKFINARVGIENAESDLFIDKQYNSKRKLHISPNGELFFNTDNFGRFVVKTFKVAQQENLQIAEENDSDFSIVPKVNMGSNEVTQISINSLFDLVMASLKISDRLSRIPGIKDVKINKEIRNVVFKSLIPLVKENDEIKNPKSLIQLILISD